MRLQVSQATRSVVALAIMRSCGGLMVVSAACSAPNTPARLPRLLAIAGNMLAVSDPTPAGKRRTRGTSVALFARVRPPLHDKAHRAAAATGVSLASYVEQLIARDEVDEHGRPLWWPRTDPSQEELPLKSA